MLGCVLEEVAFDLGGELGPVSDQVVALVGIAKQVEEKLPAILYVCGHGGVKKDGVSYGNKVHYQHHGEWFARNGYVCLTIDTLQLGEIEGIHHGTYNHDMWWWNARGYSSAGVEAWNCIRALDYLETRPEVDADRFENRRDPLILVLHHRSIRSAQCLANRCAVPGKEILRQVVGIEGSQFQNLFVRFERAPHHEAFMPKASCEPGSCIPGQ